MTAFERRVELERDICELQKKIGDDGITLSQKEISLRYAREEVEELRIRWQHHHTNLVHMRTKAEVVNIVEYAGTKSLIEEAHGKYEDVLLKVSALQKAVDFYFNSIEQAKQKIEHARTVLDGYGKILKWSKS